MNTAVSNILAVPSSICRIGADIDHHGENIQKEIFTMHQIIDQEGKGIQDGIFEQGSNLCREVESLKQVIDVSGRNVQIEMENVRKSFEKEMTDLKKTTKVVCVGMLCANILSRIILK